MGESSWFWQIVKEGVAIALFVVLAVYLPWPFQLFFLVLLGYVLWLLFRNPRFFYRRLAHSVLWVLLLPPLGELSLQFLGYSTGETGGVIRFALELGRVAPPLLLAALVVLFVAADLLSVWLDDRRSRGRIGIFVEKAVLYTECDGRYDAVIDLLVTAPPTAALVSGTGAQFKASLLSGWKDADVYRSGEGGEWIPLGREETVDLAAGKSVKLLLKGAAEASLAGRGLSWWSRRSRWLRTSYGALLLAAVPDAANRRAPVTFRLEAPEARPAPPAGAPTAGERG